MPNRDDFDVPLAAAALDAVENMILITDGDGTIVYVNPAFTAVTGYTSVEALGQNPRLLQSGVQDETFYSGMWEQIKAGERWDGELVNRRKNGELYTDRMTITPLRDGAGAIAHFVAVKRDVSSYLAALTAGNPAGIGHIDAAGGLVYANDRLSSLLGRSFDELVGQQWASAFGGNEQQIREALSAAQVNGTRSLVVLLDDGRSMRLHFAPLVLVDREQAGVVVTVQDVTAEQETLRRIREREAYIRSILESLGLPTVVVDAAGVVQDTNQQWQQQSPVVVSPQAPVVGVDYRTLCSQSAAAGGDGLAEVVAALDAVLAGGSDTAVVDYQLPGDPPRWWEVRVSRLSTDAGGAVLTHADITWRKEAQALLQRQAETDVLTGVANRAGLLRCGERALAYARETGTQVAVLFLDLDRFKPINDRHGHPAGDEVLRVSAQRLQDAVRRDDCVARVGGDEFVVACRDLNEAGVEALMDRMVRALTEPIDVGVQVQVSASVGAVRVEGHGDFAQAIADADDKMYAAKQRSAALVT